MSSYFTVPLFARAKKKQDELRKTDPQDPMLKDEDEKFLEKQIFTDEAKSHIVSSPDEDEARPKSSSSYSSHPNKPTWNKGMDLPDQEEAEAITHNYHAEAASHDPSRARDGPSSPSDGRKWASYLPSVPSMPSMPSLPSLPTAKNPLQSSDPSRTWAQYATTLLPSSLLPSRTDADALPTKIYNPDGTLNSPAMREHQSNELSVLLAHLDASALNDRVFALSADSQRLFARFSRVLRDTLAGVPTAYSDMETLMREAGPTLEAQYRALPPFVRTLVRALPARVGGLVGPAEVLARSVGGKGGDVGEAGGEKGGLKGKGRKRKRRIPGLKSLLSQEGALAGMLRGAVEFVRVRFPFLASMTNLVMSVAVFILMFVCWYCHKRGKEVRLAREAGAQRVEDDGDSLRAEYTDSGSDEESEDEDPGLEAKIEREIDKKLQRSEASETTSSDDSNSNKPEQQTAAADEKR